MGVAWKCVAVLLLTYTVLLYVPMPGEHRFGEGLKIGYPGSDYRITDEGDGRFQLVAGGKTISLIPFHGAHDDIAFSKFLQRECSNANAGKNLVVTSPYVGDSLHNEVFLIRGGDGPYCHAVLYPQNYALVEESSSSELPSSTALAAQTFAKTDVYWVIKRIILVLAFAIPAVIAGLFWERRVRGREGYQR